MKREAITHPKMQTLARKIAERFGLKNARALARGILEGIWHLAGQHCPGGDLSRFSTLEIAEFTGWDDDPDGLVELLVETRWMDSDGKRIVIHYWAAHTDRSVHQKLARGRGFFVTGERPNLVYLGGSKSPERMAAEEFYASAAPPYKFCASPPDLRVIEPEPRQSQSPAGAQPEPEREPCQSRRESAPGKTEHSLRANKSRAVAADGFERFYQAYPRKKARQRAERAWKKLSPSPELQATILADIEKRLGEDRQWRDNVIEHPATYLNEKRWTDEIERGSGNGQRIPGRTAAPQRSVTAGEAVASDPYAAERERAERMAKARGTGS